MAAAGVSIWYRAHLRRWMYRWGSSPGECAKDLPGDDLVADGSPRTTRSITIHAPAKDIWPWVAQIGEDRAGFYSYSGFERAAGARIQNANTVHPEWQHPRVGDTVWMARRFGSSASRVIAAVEPESFLILLSQKDFRNRDGDEGVSSTWSFHLCPDGESTRLIVRRSGGAIGHAIVDIPRFMVEQKMLRGIRDRVEGMAVGMASSPKGPAGPGLRYQPTACERSGSMTK